MKLTVDAKALHDAAKLITSVVEPRSSIAILSNVQLTAGAYTLFLFGADLDMELALSIPARVEIGSETTINAKQLAALTRGMTGLIEIETGEDSVTIRNARSSAIFPPLSAGLMPHMTERAWPSGFTMPAATLSQAIGQVRYAMGVEETRHNLCGLYWHIQDGGLRLVACDGARLTYHDCELRPGSDLPGVIMPAKAVNVLSKLLGTPAAADRGCDIQVDEKQMRFFVPGATLVTKTIDAAYPNYLRTIPMPPYTWGAGFDRMELLAAVKRVSEGLRCGPDCGIQIDVRANGADLSMKSPKLGTRNRLVSCGPVGDCKDAFYVGFNSRFLLDVLRAMPGAAVMMMANGLTGPWVFRDPEEAHGLHVLMPMRV